MRKRILLDLDGVLSDFVKGAAKLHQKDPAQVTDFNIAKCWSLSSNTFWSPLGYDFWSRLEPTQESAQIVKMCTEAVGEGNIGVLTSPCLTNGCQDGKRDWIHEYFPQFRKRCYVGSDKGFLANPDLLLIDDCDDNVTEFREAGGQAFLFPRPWNKNRDWINEDFHLLKKCLEDFVST